MKRATLVVALGLVVAALWVWHRPARPNATSTGQQADQPTPAPGKVAAKPVAARQAASPKSDTHVDLKRAATDPAYKSGLRRHQAIKRYLASPIKGDETLEGVLNFLLENGYSIEDLFNAYVAIMLPETDMPTREKLEKAGVAADQIPAALERNLGYWEDQIQRNVTAIAGITDPALVIGLAALAPRKGKPLGPASDFLPVVELTDGERLLRDDDWMTQKHRESAAKGASQPRRDTVEPIPAPEGVVTKVTVEPVR
jgi:hypothetical protein